MKNSTYELALNQRDKAHNTMHINMFVAKIFKTGHISHESGSAWDQSMAAAVHDSVVLVDS